MSSSSAQEQAEKLAYRTDPFPSSISQFGIDVKNSTYCELTSDKELYGLTVDFIQEHTKQSFRMNKKPNVSAATRTLQRLAAIAKSQKNGSDLKEDVHNEDSKVETRLGLGVHKFTFQEQEVVALHQTIGKPESCGGWSCNPPKFFMSLVVFVKGTAQLEVLKALFTHIIEKNEAKVDDLFFNIYRYQVDGGWWQRSGRKIARDIDTIILPQSTKNKIVEDIERFLDEKSIMWYFKHGIPYKRSYLFFGSPGSGKSSLIQSLAAKFKRNLCFLLPTHPNMTDSAFKSCIESAPNNSMIVLEDVDALFNKDRSKKEQGCPLTFSGLLNGLDGVGNPDGQIFILSTNFVDRLDSALIRSGRVDVHIEFPMAQSETLAKMFTLFYPDAAESMVQHFVNKIESTFTKGVSMAAVQQHFIQHMFKPASEVLGSVDELCERLDVEKEIKEKEKEEDEDEEEGKSPEERKDAVLGKVEKLFKYCLKEDALKQDLEKLLQQMVEKENEITKIDKLVQDIKEAFPNVFGEKGEEKEEQETKENKKITEADEQMEAIVNILKGLQEVESRKKEEEEAKNKEEKNNEEQKQNEPEEETTKEVD